MQRNSYRIVTAVLVTSVITTLVWLILPATPAAALGENNSELDITFISQGYSDFGIFHSDVQRFTEHLLAIEPFKSRTSQITVRSVDNTIDLICGTAGSVPECNQANAIAAVEASGTPYDKIVVLWNSPQNSGGRAKTTVATVYNGADGHKTFVHEFGHLLGQMRDEYTAIQGSGAMSGSYEGNCYMGLPPASAWQSVALRDYGMGCIFANWARPSKNSIMFNPYTSTYFDVVSQSMLNQQFDLYAGPYSDTIAPSVTIVDPVASSTVSGRVTITSAISDNSGIVRAELWKDGVHYTTGYDAPFSFTWDPALNDHSSHTFQVRAYDVAGNSGISETVTVNIDGGVADTEKPMVYMVSPGNGAVVYGTSSIQLYVTDNSESLGTAYFYVDGSLVGTDTTAPFTFSWATTNYAQGSHMLHAFAYDLAGNYGVTSPVTVTVDNVAPTITLTNPVNGAVLSGTTTMQAVASDDPGPLSRVEFVLDGNGVAIDTIAPYEFQWDTKTVLNGQHTLFARAYDAARYTDTALVTVTVQNNPPDTTNPTVSISSPTQGATIQGTSTVTVAASDNIAVTKVELYRDGVLSDTDLSSPFSFLWDTKTVMNGVHSLVAKAFDAAGNTASSTSRSVTVSNPDTTPPSVTISAPLNGATVPRRTNVTIQATASDNVAIQKVQFYVGTTLKCTDTTLPYSCVWKTPSTQGAQTLKATATDTSNNTKTTQISVNVN